MGGVRFSVLGPLEVVVDGRPLALGGPKQRLVLALLLLDANRVVPTDRIVDAVWGEQATERSTAVVQVYVSNLRKALEPACAAQGTRELIVTQRPGYVVGLGPDHLDVLAFAADVAAARAAAVAGDPRRAAARYRAALGRWRGEALADLDGFAAVEAIRARTTSERHEARIELLDAELAAGRHSEVLPELEELVAEDPLDERVRGQLMLALYRAGRQAEALAAFHAARAHLVDQLGIEPGRALRALEARILAHDPALDLAPVAVAGAHDPSTVVRSVSGPTPFLVVGGQRVPLVRTVTTIGRRADRHVVLDGDEVSRAHAELRRVDDAVVLVDVGSANGTRVNGERTAEARLADGDVIVIGGHVLRFEAVAAS